MKSLRILPVLFVLAFVVLSSAAYGGCSARFQGYSEWQGASTADSGFSAYYDCGNALSTGYSWDFGDGNTGSGLLVYNTYSNPGSTGAYQVSFTLTCSDGCAVTAKRYLCFTIGAYDCIQPDQGWN